MRQHTRKLAVQNLEDRRLMAADLSAAGELRIETGSGDDRIEVSIERSFQPVQLSSNGFQSTGKYANSNLVSMPLLTERVVYRNRNAQGRLIEQRRFDLDDVSQIRVYANGGDDRVQNRTSIHARIYGGPGDDQLLGGPAVDYLYGNDGDDFLQGGGNADRLYGHAGDDVLEGNVGADRLYGHSGDDTLRGGRGDDRLYGHSGRDNLYGQQDDDHLDAGSGDDGLFGGRGTDYMRGSTGDDRFLVVRDTPVGWWMDTADTIADLNSSDARIDFVNGNQTTFQFSGGNWTEFAAGQFTDAEIELIDIGLGQLHRRTGNTELLKTGNLLNDRLTFERLGAQIDGNFPAAGVNSSGKIVLVDATFTQDGDDTMDPRDEDWLMQVIYHEVAHNFDNENSRWGEWKSISGWRSSTFWFWEDSSGYNTSTDGGWAYDSDAQFARNYGRFNPMEDFATYFAKTMMDYSDRTYLGGNTTSAAKEVFMDEFFAELA